MSTRCHLQTGNYKIKQVQKSNYLGINLTDDVKTSNTEIWSLFWNSEMCFQDLNNVLSNIKKFVRNKENRDDNYLISVFIYVRESWTIFSRIKKRFETIEMEHFNEEILWKMEKNGKFWLEFRKRQLDFFKVHMFQISMFSPNFWLSYLIIFVSFQRCMYFVISYSE